MANQSQHKVNGQFTGMENAGFLVTTLTCSGNISDPDFPYILKYIKKKLEKLLETGDQRFLLVKVEPWNSVRVTFNIPREAAQRLRLLAERGDRTLQELGILSVQIEGDRLISVIISGRNNQTQEIILRTEESTDSNASTFDLSSSDDMSSRGNSDNTRKNIAQYLNSQGTSDSGDLFVQPSSGLGGSECFKSPNVVAPNCDPIPFPPPVPRPSFPPVRSNLGPFPFASMTHAMNTMANNQSSPIPRYPISSSPQAGPPRLNYPAQNPHLNNMQRLPSDRNMALSSPLLVNLLQSDMSPKMLPPLADGPPKRKCRPRKSKDKFAESNHSPRLQHMVNPVTGQLEPVLCDDPHGSPSSEDSCESLAAHSNGSPLTTHPDTYHLTIETATRPCSALESPAATSVPYQDPRKLHPAITTDCRESDYTAINSSILQRIEVGSRTDAEITAIQKSVSQVSLNSEIPVPFTIPHLRKDIPKQSHSAILKDQSTTTSGALSIDRHSPIYGARVYPVNRHSLQQHAPLQGLDNCSGVQSTKMDERLSLNLTPGLNWKNIYERKNMEIVLSKAPSERHEVSPPSGLAKDFQVSLLQNERGSNSSSCKGLQSLIPSIPVDTRPKQSVEIIKNQFIFKNDKKGKVFLHKNEVVSEKCEKNSVMALSESVVGSSEDPLCQKLVMESDIPRERHVEYKSTHESSSRENCSRKELIRNKSESPLLRHHNSATIASIIHINKVATTTVPKLIKVPSCELPKIAQVETAEISLPVLIPSVGEAVTFGLTPDQHPVEFSQPVSVSSIHVSLASPIAPDSHSPADRTPSSECLSSPDSSTNSPLADLTVRKTIQPILNSTNPVMLTCTSCQSEPSLSGVNGENHRSGVKTQSNTSNDNTRQTDNNNQRDKQDTKEKSNFLELSSEGAHEQSISSEGESSAPLSETWTSSKEPSPAPDLQSVSCEEEGQSAHSIVPTSESALLDLGLKSEINLSEVASKLPSNLGQNFREDLIVYPHEPTETYKSPSAMDNGENNKEVNSDFNAISGGIYTTENAPKETLSCDNKNEQNNSVVSENSNSVQDFSSSHVNSDQSDVSDYLLNSASAALYRNNDISHSVNIESPLNDHKGNELESKRNNEVEVSPISQNPLSHEALEKNYLSETKKLSEEETKHQLPASFTATSVAIEKCQAEWKFPINSIHMSDDHNMKAVMKSSDAAESKVTVGSALVKDDCRYSFMTDSRRSDKSVSVCNFTVSPTIHPCINLRSQTITNKSLIQPPRANAANSIVGQIRPLSNQIIMALSNPSQLLNTSRLGILPLASQIPTTDRPLSTVLNLPMASTGLVTTSFIASPYMPSSSNIGSFQGPMMRSNNQLWPSRITPSRYSGNHSFQSSLGLVTSVASSNTRLPGSSCGMNISGTTTTTVNSPDYLKPSNRIEYYALEINRKQPLPSSSSVQQYSGIPRLLSDHAKLPVTGPSILLPKNAELGHELHPKSCTTFAVTSSVLSVLSDCNSTSVTTVNTLSSVSSSKPAGPPVVCSPLPTTLSSLTNTSIAKNFRGIDFGRRSVLPYFNQASNVRLSLSSTPSAGKLIMSDLLPTSNDLNSFSTSPTIVSSANPSLEPFPVDDVQSEVIESHSETQPPTSHLWIASDKSHVISANNKPDCLSNVSTNSTSEAFCSKNYSTVSSSRPSYMSMPGLISNQSQSVSSSTYQSPLNITVNNEYTLASSTTSPPIRTVDESSADPSCSDTVDSSSVAPATSSQASGNHSEVTTSVSGSDQHPSSSQLEDHTAVSTSVSQSSSDNKSSCYSQSVSSTSVTVDPPSNTLMNDLPTETESSSIEEIANTMDEVVIESSIESSSQVECTVEVSTTASPLEIVTSSEEKTLKNNDGSPLINSSADFIKSPECLPQTNNTNFENNSSVNESIVSSQTVPSESVTEECSSDSELSKNNETCVTATIITPTVDPAEENKLVCSEANISSSEVFEEPNLEVATDCSFESGSERAEESLNVNLSLVSNLDKIDSEQIENKNINKEKNLTSLPNNDNMPLNTTTTTIECEKVSSCTDSYDPPVSTASPVSVTTTITTISINMSPLTTTTSTSVALDDSCSRPVLSTPLVISLPPVIISSESVTTVIPNTISCVSTTVNTTSNLVATTTTSVLSTITTVAPIPVSESPHLLSTVIEDKLLMNQLAIEIPSEQSSSELTAPTIVEMSLSDNRMGTRSIKRKASELEEKVIKRRPSEAEEENKVDLAFYSKPLKRKCSENAAELIKACMGVEDNPKKVNTSRSKSEELLRGPKDKQGEENKNLDAVRNVKNARSRKDSENLRNRRSRSSDEKSGKNAQHMGESGSSSEDDISLSELAHKSRAKIRPNEDHKARNRRKSSRDFGEESKWKSKSSETNNKYSKDSHRAEYSKYSRRESWRLGDSEGQSKHINRDFRDDQSNKKAQKRCLDRSRKSPSRGTRDRSPPVGSWRGRERPLHWARGHAHHAYGTAEDDDFSRRTFRSRDSKDHYESLPEKRRRSRDHRC